MKFLFATSFLFIAFFSNAQNPWVNSILSDIQIDSLVNFVENISGEKGVVVDGNLDTIYSRHKSKPGNELAFKYLLSEFERYGLQTDSMIFSATGKNVLAIQPGTLYPNKFYIICAHYDDMPNLPIAPAADDDGSGVGAVLEAARVLSKYQFEYTIVYAIWDEEEQGKVGSLAYANLANTNNDSIMGVINMDAIAWDSDNDDVAMIHTKNVGNSIELSDTIQSVNTTYVIGLNLAITNPGATYSDHASFWTNSFGAVLVIEDWTFDSNPHYHLDTDLIAYFNLPYYLKLSKLSIASLATMAIPIGFLGTEERKKFDRDFIRVYPNPMNDYVFLDFSNEVNEIINVSLYDIQGKKVFSNSLENKSSLLISTSEFPNGLYLLEVNSANESFKMKLVK